MLAKIHNLHLVFRQDVLRLEKSLGLGWFQYPQRQEIRADDITYRGFNRYGAFKWKELLITKLF